MRSLSDIDLLELWEGGLHRHPLDRALMALGAVIPETPYESLADWPLGRRNSALAEIHCRLFGPDFNGWVSCLQCAEKLEFNLDGRALIGPRDEPDLPSADDQPGKTVIVKDIAFRLPTSRDLAAAAREVDPRMAAIRIVECCRISEILDPDGGNRGGAESVAGRADSWTDDDLEAIGDLMAQADPLAESRLDLHCPRCEADWQETLDIASFLWVEIEARARRLLMDIHTLASAYGWTESEILALSENRRARYVEMVQS